MKRILQLLMIVTMGSLISGCASECTEEDLKQKGLELTQKLQEAATSGDMSKIMSMTQKMQKLKAMSNDKDDLQAACNAMDELLDEL